MASIQDRLKSYGKSASSASSSSEKSTPSTKKYGSTTTTTTTMTDSDRTDSERQSSVKVGGPNNVFVVDSDAVWMPANVIKMDPDTLTATVAIQEYESEQEILTNTPLKRPGRYTKPAKYHTINLKKYSNNLLPLQNVDHQGNILDYDDMVNLPHLSEAAILYNLKNRHIQGLPYTRTGDIVIAVNPYQWFEKLYTDEKKDMYSKRLVWEPSDCDPRSYLLPHVYEISSLAFKGIAIEQVDQSILVSGESGAGKTETVKICMDHIACVQHGPTGSKCKDDSKSAHILQMVLETSPLLEAFGYAKTRKNDNSSRFGKYTQLQFDMNTNCSNTPAKLAGSKCEVYLLEKNRVIGHSSYERTFHIFYQLLDGLSENHKVAIWDGLSNTNSDSFAYVGCDAPPSSSSAAKKGRGPISGGGNNNNCNGKFKLGGLTDSEQFYQHTKQSLDLLGIVGEKYKTLMRAICIVLQLGNIRFDKKNIHDDDVSVIASNSIDDLNALGKLMGIDDITYLQTVLTERTVETKNEKYKVPLNPMMAKDACNAFAKEIYGKVFLWIVRTINDATCAENNYENGFFLDFGTIGLLDIFGFEVFEINRFEQLCINYANEKLQQKFTEDIFSSVKLEYEKEGIPLSEITFDENTDVLDLIEGRNGLLAILNEECIRPKGNSSAFVAKALQLNEKSPCLVMDSMDKLNFGIRHFAGNVMYDAESFVDRNKDTLPYDLTECAIKCKNNTIISKEFREEKPIMKGSLSKRKVPLVMTKKNQQKSYITAATVWTKYKEQLTELMATLQQTRSRYIRCLKPNSTKAPIVMEHRMTIDQLRAAGVVAGVMISRSAFPNHLDHKYVIARYSTMWDKRKFPVQDIGANPSKEKKTIETCKAIMACALQNKEVSDMNGKLLKAFAVGKTRTYFRSGALEYLESKRLSGLGIHAIVIQKYIRRYLVYRSVMEKLNKEKYLREKQLQEERAERERVEREAKELADARESRRKSYAGKIDELKKSIHELDDIKTLELDTLGRRSQHAIEMQEQFKEKLMSGGKTDKKEEERALLESERAVKRNEQEMKILQKDRKKLEKEHKRVKAFLQSAEEYAKAHGGGGSENGQVALDVEKLKQRNKELKEESRRQQERMRELTEQLAKTQEIKSVRTDQRIEAKTGLLRIVSLVNDHCDNRDACKHANLQCTAAEEQAKLTLASVEERHPMPAPYEGMSC